MPRHPRSELFGACRRDKRNTRQAPRWSDQPQAPQAIRHRDKFHELATRALSLEQDPQHAPFALFDMIPDAAGGSPIRVVDRNPFADQSGCDRVQCLGLYQHS